MCKQGNVYPQTWAKANTWSIESLKFLTKGKEKVNSASYWKDTSNLPNEVVSMEWLAGLSDKLNEEVMWTLHKRQVDARHLRPEEVDKLPEAVWSTEPGKIRFWNLFLQIN